MFYYLELRGKIKGNWIGTGEGFTIKFFNKRKAAFIKRDFLLSPYPVTQQLGASRLKLLFNFWILYCMQFFKKWVFSPFWSFRNPRTKAMERHRVPWRGKLNVQNSWIEKATWLTCYTVPVISFSLGITKTNCFISLFFSFKTISILQKEFLLNTRTESDLLFFCLNETSPCKHCHLRAHFSSGVCNFRIWS